MKTWSLAKANKDEILQYVLNDSKAIYKIHNKFEESIIDLLCEYTEEKGIEHKKCKHNISEEAEKLFNFDRYNS